MKFQSSDSFTFLIKLVSVFQFFHKRGIFCFHETAPKPLFTIVMHGTHSSKSEVKAVYEVARNACADLVS